VQPEASTLPELLHCRLERDAHRKAVVSDEHSIDYAGIDIESGKIAAVLVDAGVVKGARVGVMMPNGIDWVCTAIAILRIGAILVPISTLLRSRELAQQLRVAAVTHLILVDGFRGHDYLAELREIIPAFEAHRNGQLLDAALPSLRIIWRWEVLKRLAGESPSGATSMVNALGGRVVPADDMAIVFTSGWSGVPKGVIHTHGNALRAVAAGLEVRCITREDRIYIPMPFFWIDGLAGGLLSAFSIGATLLTESIAEPDRTLRFLERERVTLFRGWPEQAAQLARHPDFATVKLDSLRPGSLDAVLPAAARSVSSKARARLFGMTETFGPYCGARLDRDMPEAKWGSCGRPLEGVEVRIVDPETGEPAKNGTPGMIQVRGRTIMRGICGLRREQVFDHDGYYATGDLGYLDADGYLYFTGRQDDMLKVKGATVYPIEVEDVLNSIPGVQRAFVVGVRTDDDKMEVGAAVVVTEEAELQAEQLARAASKGLSAFKVPSRWLTTRSWSELPMLASGKIDKPALQRILAGVTLSQT
jgi:acyl-CoA synthetase (AMP-forming)/AMP-acid ligase II